MTGHRKRGVGMRRGKSEEAGREVAQRSLLLVFNTLEGTHRKFPLSPRGLCHLRTVPRGAKSRACFLSGETAHGVVVDADNGVMLAGEALGIEPGAIVNAQ